MVAPVLVRRVEIPAIANQGRTLAGNVDATGDGGGDDALMVFANAVSGNLQFVTYNKIAMPRLAVAGSLELYYLQAPAAGVNELFASWRAVNSERLLTAYVLSGAQQTVPDIGLGSGNGAQSSLNVQLLAAAEGDLVFGAVAMPSSSNGGAPADSSYNLVEAVGLIETDHFVSDRIQPSDDSNLDFLFNLNNPADFASIAVAVAGTRLIVKPAGAQPVATSSSRAVRYNSGARYNAGSHYDQLINDLDGKPLTLSTVIESAGGPIEVGEALRIFLAVLAGRDTGAQLNSSEAEFFAPDGTTRRLRADLDGQGNRTNTDLEG